MNRPLFILIHGFRGTHHGLELIASALHEPRVLIPDLPGFGEGDTLSSYSLNEYVEWLHSFITAHAENEKIVLIGHSFGSIITSTYAAQHPETLEKLVLINPIGAPALEGPRAVLSKLALFYYKVGGVLPGRLSDPWLRSKLIVRFMSEVMTKTKDPQLKAFINDQHDEYFSQFHDARGLTQIFQTSISNSVRDVAITISVPTLLIAGEKDDITPVAQQKILKELIPDSALEIIPDVGHLTHYETPARVAELIQAFTKRS